MSELKTGGPAVAPLASETEGHGHAVNFNSYLRRCVYVFIAMLCSIALMIWISYLPESFTWRTKVALIVTVASVNAFVVAGFLMHLLSEKKMIYTLLGFTACFFAGLMWLTLYAMHDMPTGTAYH